MHTTAENVALRGEEAISHLKQEGSYDSLAAAMAATQYHFEWRERQAMPKSPATFSAASGGAWQASNPAQGLNAWFDGNGLLLLPRQSQPGTPDWRLSLELTGYGYGESLTALSTGEMKTEGNRINIRKSTIEEWYVNKPEGLEQGFTLRERPAGGGNGEKLRLALRVSGELRGEPAAGGQSVALKDEQGQIVLGYDKLAAWDAAGKTLPATMTLNGSDLTLEVDDAGATYPLTIDPTFTQQAKLTAGDGAADDRLGAAVAISGNTVMIGAPDSDPGGLNLRGSVQVFIRNGLSWSFQARLVGAFTAGGRFGSAVGLSGDRAVIGEPFYSGTSASQGAAYVFTRSNGLWTQQSLLTASDASMNANFGRAVAIESTRILVGATGLGQNTVSGAAYVFQFNGSIWVQEQKLTPSDGAAGDLFGWSVALSGTTAVIGSLSDDIGPNAGQGSAYVFLRSGATWSQQAKLIANDGAASNFLGWSVAVSGNTALVGAYVIGQPGPTGNVYVFTRSGVTWTQQQKLTGSDSAGGDGFGYSVALFGDQAIIGAPYHDLNGNGDQGAVYSFTRAGNVWTQQQKFTSADAGGGKGVGTAVALSGETVIAGAAGDDIGVNANQGSAYIFSTTFPNQFKVPAGNGAANDYFGSTVAVDGNTAIVGAPSESFMGSGPGAAYIFVRNGANWTQQQILTAPDGASGDGFGSSVAISSDTVLIGAGRDEIGANIVQGSAYVFTRSGTVWSFQQKLTAGDGIAIQVFGSSVSLIGNLALIGAPGAEGVTAGYAGAAYIFTRSGTTWTQQQKLVSSDGLGGDRFGSSVSLSGLLAVIGAAADDFPGANSQGSAYIFEQLAGVWTQRAKLAASDGGASDFFGSAVAIGGTPVTVLVGAPIDTVGGQIQQGSAYIFTGSGTVWTQQQKLTAGDGAADDLFGQTVSISNNLAVIGAYGKTLNDIGAAGAAYVFRRNGATWTERDRLTAADGATADQFGFSASINGGTALVGAPFKDAAALDQGAAYFFSLCPNTITVNPAGLPNATAGTAYNQTISATGGNGAVTFAVTSGTLPAGLTLNGANGVLSGTPTTAGTANFTVTASDATGCPGSRAYALTVSCPIITISPASLPAGTVNAAYSQAITTTGGTGAATFTLQSGALPTGMTLSSGGVLSGTTTQTGTFNFTVRAQDPAGCPVFRTYTLTINCQTITVNPTELPNPTVSVAYNQTLTTTGAIGAVSFSLISGSLPTGLTLSAGGVISGTTTSSATFTFTARVIDANGCIGSRVYTLTPGCTAILVRPSVIPNAGLGVAYSQQFTQTGGVGMITWSVGSGTLPPGLSLLSSGLLSGTPNTPGTYTFSIQANAPGGCAGSAQYTLVIPCPTILLNPATLPDGMRGTFYSQTLTQTGGSGAINWVVSGEGPLPAGLSLNAGSGVLSGTPNETGLFPITITAMDVNGCVGTRNYLLSINCQTINLTPATLPAATAGTNYNQVILQNGGALPLPFTFSLIAGALPPGLTFSAFPINAAIVGTPTQAGTYDFTIRVTDGNNCPGERAYTMTVNCPTITISPTALPDGRFGVAYNQTFTQTGGVGTINWSFTGALPNGLSLDAATGVISGVPNLAGTYNFTVIATDANGCVGTRMMNLVILPEGVLVLTDFSNGIPAGWDVIHNGNGIYPDNTPATWTTTNPCNRMVPPPFSVPFAIVDASCASPGSVLDESLLPPAFDTTGLGTVYVEFFNRYLGLAAPGNIGDVDVSTNGGVSWPFNALHLQNVDDGFPTPNTKSLNITPFVAGNPSNVRIRLRYTGVGGAPAFRASHPNSPDAQELSWGIDFAIYHYLLTPTSNNFPITGGTGNVVVATSANVPSPQGAWTAVSNVPWIVVAGSGGGTGNGSVGYMVATNTSGSPRTGTMTIAGKTLTITQDGCSTIAINPETLPNGSIGAAYSQMLTATGGTAPYGFGVTAGTLPDGLTLSEAGLLSGTPTASGTFTFTVGVRDETRCPGTRQYTVIVSGLQFYPLPQPVRLLETRAGLTGCTTPGAAINAGRTFTLQARTACAGIPASAQAVTGNVTVVPTGGGFLTLFPSSAQQPTVANSNFGPGEVTNNVFTVGLGAADGAFKIFASGTTHVIVDVTGYYAPPGTGGLYFHPLATPVRLLETRAGLNGCVAPGAQLIGTGDPNADPNLDLAVQGRSPVASPCNSIPSTAQVLVGNATSVVPSNGGFLTIYPSGGTRPLIASSNYGGNDVINGPFAVKLGADGRFKIYTLRTTHLVIDILGYYSEEAVDANGVGLLFNPLPVPVRLLETRPDFPNFPLPGCTRTNAPIQGNLNAATHTQQAAGFCGLPATAQAVVGNASVVSTPGAGFLTLFPGNLTIAPLVATSNYPTPAAAGYNRHYFVGLSPVDGTFKVLTQFTTELILDASGYFAP
ncbi:MAG TPA: putative Ig domain-containing protein [Blastocatellia bacterium]|nr:putative Ig domain-containing protein [Blastocatellia bacterium]